MEYKYLKDFKKLYKNGLPFITYPEKNDLHNIIDELKDYIYKDGLASIIIIDGGVGQGKTTMATHVADYIQQKNIDFDKQIGMGGMEFEKKLHICEQEKLIVTIYDEAGDFSRRGAMTKFNAFLNRIFDTYRTFKIFVIIVLPLFRKLDTALFENDINMILIHCYGKKISQDKKTGKKRGYGRIKIYSTPKMQYLSKLMDKLVVKTQAYNIEPPNQSGYFIDITPKRSLELDKISKKGKKDMQQKGAIQLEGLINYQEIATKVNRSIVWVKLKAKKLNLRHAKTYERKKYFHKDVIELLIDQIDDKR